MAEIKSQETQQEFFQEFSGAARKSERFPSLPKSIKPILINTTLEQLILAGILSILVLCLVFFLGVLRGRALTPVQRIVVTERMVPVQTTAAPAAMPVVNDPSKPYTIQLVTYKKQDLAKRSIAELRKKGYHATVIPSGEYHQVCVGVYRSIEEAKNDLRLFASTYKDCYLRRR